jgi:phage terminase large subunit-like protein
MTTFAPNPWTLAADVLDPPEWEPRDRPPLEPHQIPPAWRWKLWLLLGGRGSGKTEACARYFARHMRRNPGHRGRIIAPTYGDAVASCVEGPSGLLAIDPEIRFLPSAPGGSKVIWPNGSEAVLIGTPTKREVDRLRSTGNRHIDWWEEMAANPMLGEAWIQADFGLRLGAYPHAIASTTPRVVKRLIALMKKPTTAITRGTIFDNPHLDPEKKADLVAEYQGTRMGRQELYGELLEDVEDALWTWKMIERMRALWVPDPDLVRACVAVDPAGSSGEDADEVGIVASGKRADGLGAVLADATVQGVGPNAWARRAVALYDEIEADRLVAEVNFGGEMVEATIRTVRRNVSYAAVHASRGKRVRAEPVAALCEQGRVAMAPGLDALAEQLTGWTPESGESPGRLDAMVWGLTYLALARKGGSRRTVPQGRMAR